MSRGFPYGRRLVGKPAFKIRSLNITPRYFEPALTSASISSGTARWWTEFNFVGNFKPQIDIAASSGYNCVKFICMGPDVDTPGGNEGGDTYPNAATLYARFKSVLDYCRGKQLSVIINLMQGGAYLWGLPNGPTRLAAAQLVARWCEEIPNSPVILIDMCNEVTSYRPGYWEDRAAAAQPTMVRDLTSLSVAIRQVTSIPLTISVNLDGPSEWSSPLHGLVAPLIDVHDIHLYYGFAGGFSSSIPILADAAPFFAAPFFKGRWFAGEFGVPVADSPGGSTSDATAAAHLAGMIPLIADSRCWGTNQWCAMDCQFNNPQQWGLLNGVMQNPRAARIAAWAQLPAS